MRNLLKTDNEEIRKYELFISSTRIAPVVV